MTENSTPRIVYWPFLLADAVFLGLAYFILQFGHRPMLLWEMCALILCVAAGVWCFLLPFRSRLKLAESENLVSAAEQIKNLELVAGQISSATTLWQGIQEESAKTAASARQVAEQMSAEAKAFSEFIEKANDSEKAHLRLEVDKLRRAEGDCVQVLIHILDHVYALHRGALQSRQKAVIEQIGNFQNACCDSARRIGLVAFIGERDEPFDASKHQLLDGDAPGENCLVAETLAPGYTFQGQLVRSAFVRLRSATAASSETASTPPEAIAQPQLQL